jgi:two-component system, NarL family, nitrate/nitrite response regulator NarL
MLEAISNLINRARGFKVVGTGASANDIVELCERSKPQIAVVDLHMPGGDVYPALENAIKVSPSTKIIAFTAATGVDSAVRALDAGASGYVLKGSSTNELHHAMSAVLSGETYITRTFANNVVAALRDASGRRKAAEAVILSIREQQVIRLLMNGKTNKEIAIAVETTEKAIKHIMTALMQKLQVRNRLEVLIAARRMQELKMPAELH